MRRVLLMVFALAMFMGVGTAGATAADKGDDGKGKKECKYGAWPSGMCKAKPKCDKSGHGNTCKPKEDCDKSGPGGNCKPEECRYGTKADGTCKPKPQECKYGMNADGTCKPKPPDCPYGKDDDGKCKPPPVVVPPPAAGPCAKADLVLLEDLLKGTGALLCLYVGENAQNATDAKDCGGALLALPVDSLIGACLFLPPADVGGTPSNSAAAGGTPLTKGGPLDGLLSMVTGLFKLG